MHIFCPLLGFRGKKKWMASKIGFTYWRLVFVVLILLATGLVDRALAQDYCSSQGNNVSYEWIDKVTVGSFSEFSGKNGGYADFTGQNVSLTPGFHDIELTPGFGYNSYTEYWRIWIDLDQDGIFGSEEVVFSGTSTSSSSLTGQIIIPDAALSGDTGMRISMKYGGAPPSCGSFTYGEVEDYTVHIESEETGGGEAELNYCESNGNSVSYEWIKKVDVGSFTLDSAANGGYADFTDQIIELDTGSNPVILTPGFKYGSYYEYWSIWIDLDQNRVFSEDELLYSGGSTGVILADILIPDDAPPDIARMRISMKYGGPPTACDSFTWGEVEDYAVNISVSDTDTTPPMVESTSPLNNAYEVPVEAIIEVNFSEPMDPETITTTTFFINDGNNAIEGIVGFDSATAIFTPNITLNYDTVYTVTISTFAKDLAGNSLQDSYSWSFSTDPAPDTSPPEVVSTTPPGDAVDIPVGTTISVIFSEPIDPGTLTTGSFIVEEDSIVEIAGEVTFSGTTAVFTPAEPLNYQKVYEAMITTEVKDIAGNALEINYAWSFSTGSYFYIKGQVLLDGAGLGGVAIAMTGDGSAGATTDPEGTFKIEGLTPGGYMVTPSLFGYTFNPASLPLTVIDNDITGVEFVAFAAPVGGNGTEQKLLADDGAESDGFGGSVSISGDTAVVGASGDDDSGSESGSVYIFENIDGLWAQTTKLIPTDGNILDYFGGSVSISGNHVIAGAHLHTTVKGSYSGSAYIFEKIGGVWMEAAKIVASDGDAADWFGCSVSISGDKAIVGAMGDDDKGSNFGSAYIFEKTGGVWTEMAKLTPGGIPIGQFSPSFGVSVSISGDTAIVGANGDDGIDWNSGAAYIYEKVNGVWNETAKIAPYDGKVHDYFGSSVSIFDDRAIVGADGDDGIDPYPGSAYIFEKFDGVWAEVANLNASDGNVGDRFGVSVSIFGDRALVGANATNGNDSGSGSVYFFNKINDVWIETDKVNAFDGDGDSADHFGAAVSTNGEEAVVGAPGDNVSGSSSGSIYFFKYNTPDAVTGQVFLEGAALEGVIVTLSGGTSINSTTDSEGIYTFEGLESGVVYTITPSKEGYVFYPESVDIEIPFDQVIETDFEAEAASEVGTTIHVPADYPTIQAAIDAASGGETILVADGTYTENVKVDKSVKIKSENTPGSTEVVAAEECSHVFNVTADYVTIDGFTISGAWCYQKAGIYLENGTGYSHIINNIIGNGVVYNYYGIHINNSTGNTISNNLFDSNGFQGALVENSHDNVFTGNSFSYSGKDGVQLLSSTNNEFTNNICSSNGLNDLNGGDGIAVSSSSGNVFDGNTFNENTAYGIVAEDLSNNNVYSNNICNSNGESGIAVFESDGNTVQGNNCKSNSVNGISLNHSSGNQVANNTCSANSQAGVRLYYSEGNNVIQNQSSVNYKYGISLSFSNNNNIYLNEFINEQLGRKNVDSWSSSNLWNSPEPLSYVYNGLSLTGYLGNYYMGHILDDSDGNGVTNLFFDLPNAEPDDMYPLPMHINSYTIAW
jgi:parallel beta-helix repeat protein